MSLPLLRWPTSYPKRGRSRHTPPAVLSRTTPATPDGFGSALPPPRSVSDRPANKNRRANSSWWTAFRTAEPRRPVVRAARIISSGSGCSVGVGQGCHQAGEQDIEAAVECGGAVVGGQCRCQRTHQGELGDRQPVQAEAQHIVGFLGTLDDLLQLVEDVAVQEAEQHPVDVQRVLAAEA